MGNFYVNYTIRGTDRDKIAKAFHGRNAVLTPEKNGCIVAADEESDEQDQDTVAELAQSISKNLKTHVLAVLNHDDDVLWFQLYDNGKLADEYDSAPDYFDEGDEDEDDDEEESEDDEDEDSDEDETEEDLPKGGNAKRLCSAFGADNPSEIEDILRSIAYTFAIERHQALVEALNIPEYAVGLSYSNAINGDLPADLDEADLLRTSSKKV
jgi:hypothetical protein